MTTTHTPAPRRSIMERSVGAALQVPEAQAYVNPIEKAINLVTMPSDAGSRALTATSRGLTVEHGVPNILPRAVRAPGRWVGYIASRSAAGGLARTTADNFGTDKWLEQGVDIASDRLSEADPGMFFKPAAWMLDTAEALTSGGSGTAIALGSLAYISYAWGNVKTSAEPNEGGMPGT